MIWYNKFFRPSGYPTNIRFAQHLKDLKQTAQEYFGTTNEIDGKFAESLYIKYYTAELGLEEPDIFDLKIKAIFNQHIDFYSSLYNARQSVIENADKGVESIRQTDGTNSMTYGRTTTDKAVKDNTTITHGQTTTDKAVKDNTTITHGQTTTDKAVKDNTTVTYGHKINDKAINDKTNSHSIEYVNVGETAQSRDYEYDHTNSGQDSTAKEYEYTHTNGGQDTTAKEYEYAHTNGGTDSGTTGSTETYMRKGAPGFYNALVEAATNDIFEKFNELFKGLFMEVID